MDSTGLFGKWFSSKKAQESAPFELLVAIIIMGFVLLAGSKMLEVLQVQECRGRLDNNLERVKIAIENVAQGEGQKKVDFSIPSCFSQNSSTLKIVDRHERQVCNEFCPGSKSQCTLLTFEGTISGGEDFSNWKCLNISAALDFPSSSRCDDYLPADGYESQQWRTQPIEPGNYTLVKKFNEFSSQPLICVYKKV